MREITMKYVCQRTFNDVNARSFVFINDFFAILTIVSIIGIALETVQRFVVYENLFLFVEYFTVFFFSLEYIGRVIAADRPLKYICSFFGMIDLIAIVPSFLGMANLTFLKSVRLFRIMRFLRMMRLAKLMRLHKKHIDSEEGGYDAAFSLTMQIYASAFVSVALFSATAIWFCEGDRMEFSNIPYAMMWSSKVLLGGVSQIMPQTVAGEIIVILTRFSGLILFGLLVNIVGNGVKRIMFGIQRK